MNVDLIEESTGELIWYGSLDEFLAANELAGDLDAEDRIHLRQNLVAGEDYLFGGWHVRCKIGLRAAMASKES